MEFHVYDTRLVRKYARLLELEYLDNMQKLSAEKQQILKDTILRMQKDVMTVFEREGEDYWMDAYMRAQELLEEEHRGRLRAAEAKRKHLERRERERVEAQRLLERIAA